MGLRSRDWAGYCRISISGYQTTFELFCRCAWGHCLAKRQYFWHCGHISPGCSLAHPSNFFIKLPIHLSLIPACKPNTLPIHTAQNHSVSLFKIYYFFNQLITKPLLSLLSYKLPSIWPQTIDLSLITKSDPLPVLHSPLFIPFCKYQFCLLVMRLG